MSKEYIADKETLDEVNQKVGTNTDDASDTPTTMFSGIKKILSFLTDLKNLLSDGKTLVANAITAKGVATAVNAAFATMATNIEKISTLATDTADATATAAQILSGKTAYVKGSKVTGTIASKAAATYTPKTTNQTIAAGQYLSGVQTIKGDSNLVAANIKSGVSIFGVSGSCTVQSLGGKKLTTVTKNIAIPSTTLSASVQTKSGSASESSTEYSITLPENTMNFACTSITIVTGSYRIYAFDSGSYTSITNKNFTVDYTGYLWSISSNDDSTTFKLITESTSYGTPYIGVKLKASVNETTGVITITASLVVLSIGSGSYKYTDVKDMQLTIPITYQYWA